MGAVTPGRSRGQQCLGRLRFGTARSPAVTSGGGQRHSFTADGYCQPGGPQGPPQPVSPAASTSSAVPASPPRIARGLPAPPGLAEEEAMGCQDGSGASGYHAPGFPACGRPHRGTRQTGQAIPVIATWRRRLRPLPPAGCVRHPPTPPTHPTPLPLTRVMTREGMLTWVITREGRLTHG